MRLDRRRDPIRKLMPIDRERRTGGHAHLVGHTHDERAQPAHLFLEQTDGVIEFVAAE